MEIVGLIIKVERGGGEELSKALSAMSHVSIQGVKDNQIVLLLDTDDVHVIARNTKEINEMRGVVGVYPVFSRDSLPIP
ncbi:MAG: chaperone NapD [Nitrospirota bacterium]